MERRYGFSPQEFDLQNEAIGIIGYGRFGKLIYENLFPGGHTTIFDAQPISDASIPTVDNIEGIARASTLIIPAVPINQFRTVMEAIAPNVSSGSTVMDVCSVKEYAAQTMLEVLPSDVNLIATHPMFGPKSVEARNGSLDGLLMVMSNVRCDPVVYESIKSHFQSLGVVIKEITPQEHDVQAAQSQFFAQLMRHIAQKLALKPTEIPTPAATAIFEALNLMGSDESLFRDMIVYNKYCAEMLRNIQEVITGLQPE